MEDITTYLISLCLRTVNHYRQTNEEESLIKWILDLDKPVISVCRRTLRYRKQPDAGNPF